MVRGEYAEPDGLILRSGRDTTLTRAAVPPAATSQGTAVEDSPGGSAGPDRADDPGERRSSSLASKLLVAAGPGGDLRQACQGPPAGRSRGGDPRPASRPSASAASRQRRALRWERINMANREPPAALIALHFGLAGWLMAATPPR